MSHPTRHSTCRATHRGLALRTLVAGCWALAVVQLATPALANQPPVAVDDSVGTTENQAVTVAVTANDWDPDGHNVLLISSPVKVAPSHGTAVKVSGSSIRYTPDTGFSGSDTFQYEIGDGHGARARAWVTVTVTGVNDAPTAWPDSATLAEDTPTLLYVLANDSDPDGDALTLALSPIIEAPSHGTATRASSTTIRYTPHTNYHGSDQFRYRIRDGNGGVDSALVTLTVTSVNDQPVAVADSATTQEESAVTVTVTANDYDVDGDSVLLITNPVISTPANGTAVKVSGTQIRYTPHVNFSGTDQFRYEVGDGNGARARAWVTVTVNAVNDPPVAAPDSATVAEDSAGTFSVTANDSDPDGDPVTLAVNPILEAPLHGTAVRTSSTAVTYTPHADYHGPDQFRYRVKDDKGGVDSALVTVTVTSVNDKPVAVADTASTAEDTAVTVTVTANDTDVDGDSVLLIASPVVSGPSNGTAVKVSGAAITYTPHTNFSGTDQFQYEVGDGNGARSRAWVTVSVASTNDPPTAVADSASVAEDGSITVDVVANDSDPDGDAVTLATNAVAVGPSHGTAVRAGSRTLTYTPDADYHGPDQLTYRVVDGNGGVATAVLSLTVTPVNDPPVAVDDIAETGVDTPVVVDVVGNDLDIDDDTLALGAISQAPSAGTVVVLSATTVEYTPAAGFVGSDTFTYEVVDGNGGVDEGQVTVTVSANGPPVANDDTAFTGHANTILIDVTANDFDPDGDSFALSPAGVVAGPANGTAIPVSGSGTTIEYRSMYGFAGIDEFDYEVVDATGATATATVRVEVVNPNTCEPNHYDQMNDRNYGLWTELRAVLATGQPNWDCDYRKELSGDFGKWSSGGSENKAVLAAGIALHHDLYAFGGSRGDDWPQWWVDYLGGQLGFVDPAPAAKLEHFKASEMFSNSYDEITVAGVVAAHLWAVEASHPDAATVEGYAKHWLRANWYVYALAAGNVPPDSLTRIRASTDTVEWDPQASHYVALAGPRAKSQPFVATLALFGRATGRPVGYETPQPRMAYDALETAWPGPEVDLYGLTAEQRGYVGDLIVNAELPPDLFSTFTGLTTIRTLHFLIWPTVGDPLEPGPRAMVMEGSTPNGNHHEAIFAASFDNDSREATVLSPWKHFTSGAGSCTLHLGTLDGNYVEATGDVEGDVGYGEGVRRLQLPADPPFRHLEIGPGSPGLHEAN